MFQIFFNYTIHSENCKICNRKRGEKVLVNYKSLTFDFFTNSEPLPKKLKLSSDESSCHCVEEAIVVTKTNQTDLMTISNPSQSTSTSSDLSLQDQGPSSSKSDISKALTFESNTIPDQSYASSCTSHLFDSEITSFESSRIVEKKPW